MIVFSKLTVTEDVPHRHLGLLDGVPYSCHEFGHTWNSSCVGTWKNVFVNAFRVSLKVYTPLYLIGAILQMRKRNADRKKIIKKAILGILQSSLFLAANGTWFLVTFCGYGAIFGRYHGIFGYVIGFITGLLSIVIERKSRRGVLAVYMFNLTLECLFKMLVSRGYVGKIDKGEVYIFAIASMLFLSFFRDNTLPDFLQDFSQRVLGVHENNRLGPPEVSNNGSSRIPYVNAIPFIDVLKSQFSKAIDFLNNLGPNVPICRHPGSCSSYAVQGALRFLCIGYGLQLLTQYRSIFSAITMHKPYLLKKSLMCFSIPKFFCAFITLFRVTNCLLRWLIGQDHPQIFGGISGFVAGLSSAFYPNTSISMYAVTKMLEIVTMKAVAKQWLPYIRHFDSFLYSLSMAVIFHAAIFEPHNLRPGYWKFMCSLSGNCFPLMFRILLDKFGTGASTMYPNYIPNLDVSRVRSNEVKQVLAFFGKWPYVL